MNLELILIREGAGLLEQDMGIWMLLIYHRIILHMLLLTLNLLWPLFLLSTRVILLPPHHNPHLSTKTLSMHHSIQPFSPCLSTKLLFHQPLQIPQFHLLKTHNPNPNQNLHVDPPLEPNPIPSSHINMHVTQESQKNNSLHEV